MSPWNRPRDWGSGGWGAGCTSESKGAVHGGGANGFQGPAPVFLTSPHTLLSSLATLSLNPSSQTAQWSMWVSFAPLKQPKSSLQEVASEPETVHPFLALSVNVEMHPLKKCRSCSCEYEFSFPASLLQRIWSQVYFITWFSWEMNRTRKSSFRVPKTWACFLSPKLKSLFPQLDDLLSWSLLTFRFTTPHFAPWTWASCSSVPSLDVTSFISKNPGIIPSLFPLWQTAKWFPGTILHSW